MGCDIHLYKEKRVDGKWVSADSWESYDDEDTLAKDVPWEQRHVQRNYVLFGLFVGGVRRSYAISFQERGIPYNVDPNIYGVVDYWSDDAHSFSYLYVHELKDMVQYIENDHTVLGEAQVAATMVIDSLKDIISRFDGMDGDNHRIVFFFDN